MNNISSTLLCLIKFVPNSSNFMGREGSTKIPSCRNKGERYLKKMGYYTTVPSPFATKDAD